jgi:hypothetical protein
LDFGLEAGIVLDEAGAGKGQRNAIRTPASTKVRFTSLLAPAAPNGNFGLNLVPTQRSDCRLSDLRPKLAQAAPEPSLRLAVRLNRHVDLRVL